MSHTPVLLDEVLALLDPKPGAFVVDGTLDGGGYADAILPCIGEQGTLLGIDLDPSMVARFADRHATESSCRVVQGNYADLLAILLREHLAKANGLVLDLGFSSEQLEQSSRGFSFLRDEPLLMTYDPHETPVRELLRMLSESDLEHILRELGGERFARRVAKAIVTRGRRKPITTSGDLAEVVRSALPKAYERGRIDPATRTFQALRIYANNELGNLKSILADLPEVLAPGGRAVIVSFHSLEDRLVKNAFREGARNGTYELLTKKPIEATQGETRQNPRSRSAKLRAIKLATSQ